MCRIFNFWGSLLLLPVIPRKSLPSSNSWIFCPMFSPKSFIVLGLSFRFLIHFEWTFVCVMLCTGSVLPSLWPACSVWPHRRIGEGLTSLVSFFFFSTWLSSFPITSCWKDCSCQGHLTMCANIYFWALCSIGVHVLVTIAS